MYKLYVRIVFSLVIIIVALPFFYFKNAETVNVTHLKNTVYQSAMEVVGSIEASKYTPIKLSYPVYIKECFISENSYVNKGQLMFTIDIDKMENVVKEYNFTEHLVAEISMDKSVIMGISEEIYASGSGVVKNLTIAEGSVVLSDEQICIIESDDDMLVKLTINQEDYSRVAVGDKVSFSPDIAPERIYTATLNKKTAQIRKEKTLTGNKTVVDVFADIDTIDDYIISGLEISGTIIKPFREILTLPYEYIGQDENGEYVKILINGSTVKKYVETGTEMEGSVEILTDFDKKTLFIKNNQTVKGNSLIKYEY
ncbi:MAG: HlyD family efflux transporter periplasmic adaptor subunit [Ruminococcaceae bacterium]|nr:HlyD family efflux transporter periplasmic adaptor subunit [Oscillospiraceae bacterium]